MLVRSFAKRRVDSESRPALEDLRARQKSKTTPDRLHYPATLLQKRRAHDSTRLAIRAQRALPPKWHPREQHSQPNNEGLSAWWSFPVRDPTEACVLPERPYRAEHARCKCDQLQKSFQLRTETVVLVSSTECCPDRGLALMYRTSYIEMEIIDPEILPRRAKPCPFHTISLRTAWDALACPVVNGLAFPPSPLPLLLQRRSRSSAQRSVRVPVCVLVQSRAAWSIRVRSPGAATTQIECTNHAPRMRVSDAHVRSRR